MRVLSTADALAYECRPGNPICVALGMFDGVHLGHQHVIRQAVLDARAWGGTSVAITFDPHPQWVLQPQKAPALLQRLSQRLASIQSVGVDAALVIPFTADFSRVTGDYFVRQLCRDLKTLKSFSVGQGFHFGFQRSGNTQLLRSIGAELGFRAHALANISVGGESVSSTRIRAVLQQGKLAHVAELLGHPYALQGVVEHGRKLGRTLGFPTANISDLRGLALPPFGVYAARVRHGTFQHSAAVNLGLRPTVETGETSCRLEAHLLDFDGDLYGQSIDVELVEWVRPEKKLPDLNSLRLQIRRDILAVRRRLRE